MKRKVLSRVLAAVLCTGLMLGGWSDIGSVLADEETEGNAEAEEEMDEEPIAEENTDEKVREIAAGVYDVYDQGDARLNRRTINDLIGGDEKVIVNIKEDMAIDTYLRPGNNTTINAEKYTITSGKGVIINEATKLGYKSLTNLTINGGIWKNSSSKGLVGTMMRFAHASKININKAAIYTNYNGHGIELIACKDCKITKCKALAVGKKDKNSVEEQIQIDLATPKTAPGVYETSGAKFCKGTPSKNITITGCTVKGSRGICANYAAKEGKYRKAKNYHSGITIKNCKITSYSAEALALFNTKSAVVQGNTIINNTPVSRNSYSVGCHVAYQNGSSPKASTKNRIVIKKNTIKGGREGLFVFSHTSTKLGKVIISGNKGWAKSAKDNAIRPYEKSIKKLELGKNTEKKW